MNREENKNNKYMKTSITFLFACLTLIIKAQMQPVMVYESTMKVGAFGEETYVCGLAEGDQCIFNFEEINGKELKELEILLLPSSSKFMDYKTKKVENKIISITETGIYKFRFSNSAIAGRVCKIKIQRIPAGENTKKFNTNVYYKIKYDTTYTTEQERYLIKTDTVISNLTDQVAKVHSAGNLNGNKTTFNFLLPDNTVAWSYYIGVDQAGQQVYEQATQQLVKNGGPIITRLAGFNPLAALALGGVSYLSQLQSGEDIDFYIVDGNNVNLFDSNQQFFYLKKGKVINDYSKMSAPLKGMYHVCLSNDNAVTGVEVAVKITAIVVNQQWGVRPIQKMHVASHQEAYLKQ